MIGLTVSSIYLYRGIDIKWCSAAALPELCRLLSSISLLLLAATFPHFHFHFLMEFPLEMEMCRLLSSISPPVSLLQLAATFWQNLFTAFPLCSCTNLLANFPQNHRIVGKRIQNHKQYSEKRNFLQRFCNFKDTTTSLRIFLIIRYQKPNQMETTTLVQFHKLSSHWRKNYDAIWALIGWWLRCSQFTKFNQTKYSVTPVLERV